jgi:hypothetical protein
MKLDLEAQIDHFRPGMLQTPEPKEVSAPRMRGMRPRNDGGRRFYRRSDDATMARHENLKERFLAAP